MATYIARADSAVDDRYVIEQQALRYEPQRSLRAVAHGQFGHEEKCLRDTAEKGLGAVLDTWYGHVWRASDVSGGVLEYRRCVLLDIH